MHSTVSTESKTRKPIIIATILLVVGIAAVVLHQANSYPVGASTKTNIENVKQMEAAPLEDGQLVLNEDNETPQVAKDSCWWPTCSWANCGSGQNACVQRCKTHGLAACTGKCCQIGAPPPQRSPPSGSSGSSSSDCLKKCDDSECEYNCAAAVSCFRACVGGTNCGTSKCCGKVKPPSPPPPGPVYTWWTIGGTTTDQWCTNNCPNSRNPHCGDGIWCCGGSTHTEAECKKIKSDREKECGTYCCQNCFYLDHNGVCTSCPDTRVHPICKRKLW